MFYQQMFRGCFRPRQEGKKTIIYTAPDVVELKKFLKKPVEEEKFFGIVAQTMEMVKRIEMNGLYLHNLMLQLDLVYICERTNEVFFVYQPIMSRLTSGSVYAFLGDMTQFLIKASNEKPGFLEEFQNFLGNPENYRVEEIEQYVRMVCPQVFRKIIMADAGKSGFITNDRVMYEKHYHDNIDEESGTTLLTDEEEMATTILCEEEEGTTILAQEEYYPTLVRVSTDERIMIDRDNFLIGKSNECNYSIPDNKAVSRNHAVIEKINGSYYIVDKGSTNHTYLNGEKVENEKPYALTGGDRIQLADEEFEFEW